MMLTMHLTQPLPVMCTHSLTQYLSSTPAAAAVAQPAARNAKVTATATANALATSSVFSVFPRRRLSPAVQVRDTGGPLPTGIIATTLVSTRSAAFALPTMPHRGEIRAELDPAGWDVLYAHSAGYTAVTTERSISWVLARGCFWGHPPVSLTHLTAHAAYWWANPLCAALTAHPEPGQAGSSGCTGSSCALCTPFLESQERLLKVLSTLYADLHHSHADICYLYLHFLPGE